MKINKTINGYAAVLREKDYRFKLSDFFVEKGIQVSEVRVKEKHAIIMIADNKRVNKELIKTIYNIWKQKFMNEPTAD